MKLITQLSAGLASLGLLISASAQDAVKFNVPGTAKPAATTPAQPAAPSAPAPAPTAPAATAAAAPAKKFTEAQIAEAYGWFIGTRMGLRQLEFTKEQVEGLSRGLIGVASGAQAPFDDKEIGPEVEAFLAKKNQVFMAKLKIQQITANNEFFTKLKENKAIVESPTGLRYEIIKAGTGAVAKPGQVVTINYTGALITGQVFDATSERGVPQELLLQVPTAQNPNGVIPGMFEGLQKTGIGGKLVLYLPPSLAYGDEGVPGGIPPAAALIFEVEIVGVKDAPPAAPAPAPAK